MDLITNLLWSIATGLLIRAQTTAPAIEGGGDGSLLEGWVEVPFVWVALGAGLVLLVSLLYFGLLRPERPEE